MLFLHPRLQPACLAFHRGDWLTLESFSCSRLQGAFQNGIWDLLTVSVMQNTFASNKKTVTLCGCVLCLFVVQVGLLSRSEIGVRPKMQQRREELHYLCNKGWEMELKQVQNKVCCTSAALAPFLLSHVYTGLGKQKIRSENQNSLWLGAVSYFLYRSLARCDPAAAAISRVHFPRVSRSHSIVSQPWGKHVTKAACEEKKK